MVYHGYNRGCVNCRARKVKVDALYAWFPVSSWFITMHNSAMAVDQAVSDVRSSKDTALSTKVTVSAMRMDV